MADGERYYRAAALAEGLQRERAERQAAGAGEHDRLQATFLTGLRSHTDGAVFQWLFVVSAVSPTPISGRERSFGSSRGLSVGPQVNAYRGHIAAAQSAGVPFVISEGNTASCGGQAGVSDTLASALWSLDFLPTLSKAGAVRMNFHGGPAGPYPPIAFQKNGERDRLQASVLAGLRSHTDGAVFQAACRLGRCTTVWYAQRIFRPR